MGREIRRVPANWEHPKNEKGGYIPMYEDFPYTQEEIKEGLRDGWLENIPPHYGCDVMPKWTEQERTHFQMYETCTEGTPISPVMASIESLARWLADNHASAFGPMTATYEEWLAMCKAGNSVSCVIQDGVMMSGVEAQGGSQCD